MAWREATGGAARRLAGGRALSTRIERLVFGLDLAGAAIFAVEGAAAAMAGQLDLLGVASVAFVTALGGGIVRDILIGAAPPQALKDWRYPGVALGVGVAAFAAHLLGATIPTADLVVLDAAGLSMFAVAGATKTLDRGLNGLTAILLGGVTAVGGGVIRDVLLTRVPRVLTTDIYATAALAGAVVLVTCRALGLGARWSALLGAAACFALRMTAVTLHWNLPSAG